MITTKEIHKIVSKYFNIKYNNEDNYLNKTRDREYLNVRYFTFIFSQKYAKETLANIGKFYNKDHTTVINGIKTINNLISYDSKYQLYHNEIELKIKSKIKELKSYSKINLVLFNEHLERIKKIQDAIIHFMKQIDYRKYKYEMTLERKYHHSMQIAERAKIRMINRYYKEFDAIKHI